MTYGSHKNLPGMPKPSRFKRLTRAYFDYLHLWIQSIKQNPHCVILFFVGTLLLLVIGLNIGKPLWYDEAWRAQATSSFRLWRYDGEAPLPLLSFVLTKLMSLVYDHEITHRLLTYASGLACVPLLFSYGKKLRGKTFGLVLTIGICLSLFFTEYLTQNKPYILDFFLTVSFLYIYGCYLEKKLSTAKLFVVSVVYLLFSTPALFVFAGTGLYSIWRNRTNTNEIKRVLYWAIPLLAVFGIYYILFLHPQVTDGLTTFWKAGQNGGWLIHIQYPVKQIISIFGFPESWIRSVTIDMPLYTRGPLGYNASNPLLEGFGVSIPIMTLGGFIVGSISLVRRKQGLLLSAIGGAMLTTYFASLAGFWAFGNNRTNFFLIGLIVIVIWLGFYEVYRYFYNKRSLYPQIILIGLVVFGSLFIPVTDYARSFARPRKALYLDGMRTATAMLRKEAKPGDAIVNFHFMNEQPFLYYYQNYSPDKPKTVALNKNVMFDHKDRPLKDSPGFYRSLSKKYQTVWVVSGAGIGSESVSGSNDYYTVSKRANEDYVSLVRLTKRL